MSANVPMYMFPLKKKTALSAVLSISSAISLQVPFRMKAALGHTVPAVPVNPILSTRGKTFCQQ